MDAAVARPRRLRFRRRQLPRLLPEEDAAAAGVAQPQQLRQPEAVEARAPPEAQPEKRRWRSYPTT